MKLRILTLPLLAVALAACGAPDATDRGEDGVQVALTEWVETALHGTMSAEMTERYCTDLVTARARENATWLCEGDYTSHTNPTWKNIDSIESITITGDTATVTWWWTGQDSAARTQTSDTFIFEEGRWRHDN